MSTTVILAICSACLGASNDLIYRNRSISSDKNDVWLFYFLASAFSAVYSLLAILTFRGGFQFSLTQLTYGVVIGLISFTAYVLFLFSFDGVNNSVSFTIFHMNMIPGIILAMIFIHETITIKRVFGIILCLIGMLLFSMRRPDGGGIAAKSLLMSIGACLACGMLNFANKIVAMNQVDSFSVLFWRFTTIVLITALILRTKKTRRITFAAVKYPMLSGLVVMLSIFCMLEAFKTGAVSLVSPIAQLAFVITAVVSWAVFKEKMTPMKLLGISCGVISIFLIK